MAKLDAYKFTGGQPESSDRGIAIAKVVTPLANSSVRALGNITASLSGIDQTLKGLYSVSMTSIQNDKLKEQAERRRLRKEQDAAREDEIENRPSPGAASGIAKTGTLTGKDKSWGSKLFESLFGGFGGLLAAAAKFLISLVTFAAVRTILQIVGDPENKKKMELFLTKLQFVWNKISAFTSWLVQDNLLDGFTSLFGEDSTFGDRLQGLGKILIGIIGLKLLLDPFGLIFGVLDLLNARERAAGTPQVPGVDPSAQTPGSSKNPKTQTKIPPTRKRDSILKRSRVDRLSRLKTSLQRIKTKQAGIIDMARVGIRRPGRIPGMVGQGLQQTPKMLWRGVRGVFSGAKSFFSRIPVVGTLIHFALSILDVDDQGNIKFDIQGKGERAAYEAIGGGIGAAIGTFLPVPIIGTIIGGLLGTYGGELVYDLVKKKSPQSVMARMGKDFQSTLQNTVEGAKSAGSYITGAWNKWYRGVDKVKFPNVPDWIKNTPGIGNWVSSFPIWGMEMPDPRIITNFGEAAWKYGKNFFDALFGGVVEAGKMTFLPGANEPKVGQIAPLGGKPHVWDGNNWIPKTEYDNPAVSSPGHTDLTRNGGVVPPVNEEFQTGVKSNAPSGGAAAFKYILAIAQAAGGTKHPELVAARAMHESDWLKTSTRSVFNSTGRTNPYGQTGDRGFGSIPRAGFSDPWTLYPSIEKATQDHIYLWHSTHKFKDNANAFDTPIDAIAASINAYSPNKDPENQRRGYTENAYIKAMVSILKQMGFDPYKSKSGGASVAPTNAKASSISPNSPPTTNLASQGMEIGGADAPISSPYGTRTHPVTGQVGSHHGGIDIAVPSGTYIAVKEPGEVMGAGTYGNYGQVVDIWIPSRGIQLRFAHLSQLLVRAGTKVEAYTPIARSGGGLNDPGRGRSTGPHIHFEADTQKDGRTGGGSGNPKSYLSLIHLTKNDPSRSTKVTGKVDTAAPTGQANTVPGRPIGQKATLNGQPVVWDGQNWIPDTKSSVQLDPMAALLKGVLALPRQQKGLSPVPEDSKSAFIKGVTDGTFKLYLAPDGLPLAGAALNAGGSLVDAAGNIIGGLFGGGGSSSDGGGGGGGGAGSSDGSGINLPKNPFDEAYSKPELDDPIADYLKLAYGDIPADGPSGNPFSQPLTKEGVLNNFYGYNPLSLKDGWEIFKAKLGLPGVGSPKPKEEPNESPDVKTSDIDFSNLFNFSSGGQLPNNLPQAFLGKVFKSIGKGISNAFNGVKKAIGSIGKAVGGFLNSPIGQVVSLGLSFIPGVAPIMAGIRAVVALSQGDIMGAIVGGMGALGGMFPGTFGAEGTFFAGLNSTFGDGLGGVMKGFLTGGFGGALGALPGMLPQGMQNFFKGVGGFLEENQGVAKIAQMLPGVMASTGFGQMLGLPDPQAMGGMGSLQEVFQEGNATGILAAVMGQAMGQRSFQDALTDISAELGVDPTVLGGQMSRSRMRNPLDEKSRELALQTKIEVQQVPIVVEKLVAIPKGVPINNYVRVPVRVPVAQPQQ